MGKKKEQAVVGDRACQVPSVTVLCFSETGNVQLSDRRRGQRVSQFFGAERIYPCPKGGKIRFNCVGGRRPDADGFVAGSGASI